MATSAKDLAWAVVGFFGLALIGVKLGGLFDLNLLWLYAVAAGLALVAVVEYLVRRRGARPPDVSQGGARAAGTE